MLSSVRQMWVARVALIAVVSVLAVMMASLQASAAPDPVGPTDGSTAAPAPKPFPFPTKNIPDPSNTTAKPNPDVKKVEQPTAPTNVVAVATNGGAKLTWDTPSSGKPDRYIATAATGGATCKQDPATLSPNCTITGLTNGTSYTFTVIAQNGGAFGKKDSPPSTVSNSVIPMGPPGPATGVTATAGNQSATVTWVAPKNTGGSPVTGYTVATTGGLSACTTSGDTTTCQATQLTNGTSYAFIVTTITANGSSASTASNSVIPNSKPSAPTDVQATANNSSATVTWTPPADNGGLPIKSYAIQTNAQSDSGEALGSDGATASKCDPLATTCEVTGLKNGTLYSFQVSATDTAGQVSPWSAPSAPVEPGQQPPDPPTNVVGTPVKGGGAIDVSWDASASPGSTWLVSYTVTAFIDNNPVPGAQCTKSRIGLIAPGTNCTISKLTNGTAYTFSVVAANKTLSSPPSSASAPVAPVGVPAAPTNVTAAPGNGMAVVSWTAPPTAGSPITGYNVYSIPSGAKCSPPTTPTPVATQCAVQGLTNGKAVSFTVEAMNLSGTGPESTPSNQVTPAGPPSPPTGVTAVVQGDSTIVTTWKAPKNDGGAQVQSFTATAFSGSTASGQCFGSAVQTTCPINSLSKGTAYTVSVIATNVAGQSQPSNPSEAVTPGTSNPSAPTGVSGKAGNQQIEASWTAPSTSGASRINGYVVTATPASSGPGGQTLTPGTCSTSSKITKPATSCKVANLANGVAYTLTVVASNAEGTSPSSDASPPVTPAGAPSPPLNVTATGGQGSIFVNWDQPGSDGGSPISGYVATAVTGPIYARKTVSCPSTTDTHCTIPGLTNGSTYEITVVATNQAGFTSSASGGSATPYTTPGAPRSVTGKGDDKQVTVSWDAPKDDGGNPVSGYNVTASPGGATCTSGATDKTCVVDQLDNGTAYTFSVTASNEAGAGPSATSKPITPGKVQSDPPTNVAGTAGNGSVTVTWDKPDDTGTGIPLQYEVQTVEDNTLTCSRSVILSNQCKVTGLTNGTAYTFQARLVTTKGKSDWSAASPAVTPGGPPGPATSVVGTPGNASVAVTWEAPANTGGSGLKSYTVTAVAAGVTASAKKPSCSTDAPTTNCTVEGLTNGTAYQFVVTTTSNSGETSTSTPSPSVIPVGPPTPPTNVKAQTASGAVTLSWDQPKNTGGSAIDHYTVTATSSAGGGSCTSSGTNKTCTVSSLTNHIEYTFTVTATNVGPPQQTSGASTPVKATPGKYTPDTPTDVTGVAGNTKVKVSWTAPAQGGPIKFTVVTASPGDQTCTAYLTETSCTVNKLTNGQGYSFTANATNWLGLPSGDSPSSATVTPGTVPSPPLSVTATPGDSSITVNWQPPTSDGGSPITGYVATASTKGSASSCPAPEGTSCDIGNLVNGEKYTVTVVATNAFGSSKAGKASGSVIPLGPPTPPLDVVATAGIGNADVQWKTPTHDGGKELTSYTVTTNNNKGEDSATQTCTTKRFLLVPPALHCKVPGLVDGTTYTFVVTATNNTKPPETSPQSDPSNAVTPGGKPPTAPLNPAASSDTSQQAVVTWNAPESSGSALINDYEVTSSPGGLTCHPLIATFHSCTVKKLTNATAYTFTVTAHNKYGWGPASVPTNSVTPAGAPTAPQNVLGVAGDKQITAQWTAPASDGGKPITGYIVKVTDLIGIKVGGCTAAASATSCLVDGLKDGTRYGVYVAATNGMQGPWASDPNWVVPSGDPTQPLGVTAEAGVGEATVKWEAPTDSGGSNIVHYAVSSANDKGSPNGTCTTDSGILGIAKKCKVTGLTNGTPYVFTVVATNKAGKSSLPSAPSAPVTPGSKVPSPPTDVMAQGANQSAVVSWSPPTDQGGAVILSYKVTATTGIIKPSCKTAATELSCTVTGLKNGNKYQFDVVAINIYGASQPAVSPEVTPAGVPDAPTPLSVGGMAGKDNIVAWWGVPTTDGGSPITSYTATASPGGQSCTATSSTAGSKPLTFCTIPGLTPGGTYKISVFATNANGNSPTSTGAKAITVPAVPGAPTNVYATIANGIATLHWTPPAYTGGSAISYYTIVPNFTLGSFATCGTTPLTFCTIGPLGAGAQAQWSVTANNTQGQVGVASAFSNIVVNNGGSDGGGGRSGKSVMLTSSSKAVGAVKFRIYVKAQGIGAPTPRKAAVRVNDRNNWKAVKLNRKGAGWTTVRVAPNRNNEVHVRAPGAATQTVTFRSQ